MDFTPHRCGSHSLGFLLGYITAGHLSKLARQAVEILRIHCLHRRLLLQWRKSGGPAIKCTSSEVAHVICTHGQFAKISWPHPTAKVLYLPLLLGGKTNMNGQALESSAERIISDIRKHVEATAPITESQIPWNGAWEPNFGANVPDNSNRISTYVDIW